MEQLKAKAIDKYKANKIACWIRALRLPFISASIFPFAAGTFLFSGRVELLRFITGLVTVIATHLGANLINDYADSRSGADWHDKKFYGLFGGSKLIQEQVLSERTYLRAAVSFFTMAFICVLFLMNLIKNASIIGFYLFILAMGIAYSQGPLRLSYRYLGEAVIFILFGPALVMGGYFIQSSIFPSYTAFLLAVPFGLFTTAILFANEVPDYKEDIKAKKFTLVKLTGIKHAYILYYLLSFAGIISVLLNINAAVLTKRCLGVLIFVPLILKAGAIIKAYYNDKSKLINASKLAIFLQTGIGLLILMDLII